MGIGKGLRACGCLPDEVQNTLGTRLAAVSLGEECGTAADPAHVLWRRPSSPRCVHCCAAMRDDGVADGSLGTLLIAGDSPW